MGLGRGTRVCRKVKFSNKLIIMQKNELEIEIRTTGQRFLMPGALRMESTVWSLSTEKDTPFIKFDSKLLRMVMFGLLITLKWAKNACLPPVISSNSAM